MISMMFDCNYCVYCSPKEGEQSVKKEPHKCQLTGNQLFHWGMHPYLPIPKDCPIGHCLISNEVTNE